MAAWVPLALDAYAFASLRQAGQAYVDQTAHIQRMPAEPIQYALPARPRRCGQSLLALTLAHLCSRADDAFFQDLAVAAYVPQAPQVPVVLLDMALIIIRLQGKSGVLHRARVPKTGGGSRAGAQPGRLPLPSLQGPATIRSRKAYPHETVYHYNIRQGGCA